MKHDGKYWSEELNKSKTDFNTITLLIAEVIYDGGNIYFDRKVFIDHNFDDEEIWKSLKSKPSKFKFVPSDDPEEHPGVIIKYDEKSS